MQQCILIFPSSFSFEEIQRNKESERHLNEFIDQSCSEAVDLFNVSVLRFSRPIERSFLKPGTLFLFGNEKNVKNAKSWLLSLNKNIQNFVKILY
jgi:hypothetical protein